MTLSPSIAKLLPEKLRLFCERLRYPYVFLASIPLFIISLLASQHIPYPEQVLGALGLILFVSSKARL